MLLNTILRLGTKFLVFLKRVVVIIVFSSHSGKRKKAHDNFENEYDEITAQMTKRKYFH